MSIKNGKVLPDLSKLEPLDCVNYRHWSQKLLIFEQLEVNYILSTEAPDVTKNVPTVIDPETSKEPLAISNQSKQSSEIDPNKYEKDNKDCFLLHHKIALEPVLKQYLIVECLSFTSPICVNKTT